MNGSIDVMRMDFEAAYIYAHQLALPDTCGIFAKDAAGGYADPRVAVEFRMWGLAKQPLVAQPAVVKQSLTTGPAAPAFAQILFRADRMPPPDADGFCSHPDLECFCTEYDGLTLKDPGDEGIISKQLLAAVGFDCETVELGDDVPEDHPAYIRYLEIGGCGINDWAPTPPEGEGWRHVGSWDTEDGPVAMFVRPRAADPATTEESSGVPAPDEARKHWGVVVYAGGHDLITLRGDGSYSGLVSIEDYAAPVSAPAQGLLQLPADGAYIIRYDDTDKADEFFAMTGARDGAFNRYRQISGNWSAHLYVKIDSNSRDAEARCPSAKFSAPADARDGGPKHGDDAGDGLRYVLCKVGFGTHYGNWLLIPHADGQYVTAAKLEPFSMSILRHQLAAIDRAMGAEGGDV